MNMQLPTLYSRNSDGSVQQWTIEVDGPRYRMISGKKDGALVESEWTVVQGKNQGRANATTPEQQAMAEAKSRWQKKLDGGYFENLADIDSGGSIPAPMLAKVWGDYAAKVRFPVWCQPKFDGMRCIATPHGLYSRNGNPILTAPHIEAALRPTFAAHPDWILDGELYCHAMKDDFNRIISIVKKVKPSTSDLAESARTIQYHIYDRADGSDRFTERWNDLNYGLVRKPGLVLAPTFLVQNQDTLDRFYAAWLEAGYEGQMVRLDTSYEHKRSANLLKRKEFQDAEFTVLDVLEGTGNRSGMAGMLAFRTNAGVAFTAAPKGTDEYRVGLLRNRASVIGQKATVKYFGVTPDGSLRFPVVVSLRPDGD